MKNSLMVILAGGLLCASSASVGQSPQTNTVDSKSKPKEKTYCLQSDGDSGSHIKRVECRTKNDWQRLGVDVDEMQK